MRRSFIGVISVVVVVITAGLIIAALIAAPLQAQTRVGVSDPAPNPLLQQLARDNTAFGMDLYAAFRENDGNFFFSPYSISEAFAMLYAGARGQTAEEMAKTLHITLEDDMLTEAYHGMGEVFDQKINIPRDDFRSDDKFRLKVANGLWSQEGFPIRDEYASVLRDCYQSEPASLDFVKDAEGSRRIINTWVSDKTEGMIKDILPPNALNSETQLVLANTIYFEAKWNQPFLTEETTDGSFSLLDDTIVTVPMMHRDSQEFITYAEDVNWQATTLEYRDSNMGMLIILPRPGKFSEVELMLDSELLAAIDDSSHIQDLILTLPKFACSSPSLDLTGILKQLGMKSVFTDSANLSGITSQPLFLSKAYHKASVSVDEEGTIAAGATVLPWIGSRNVKPIEFTADRPFIFLIRDLNTKAVLFMGRVLDPTE